MTMNDLLDNLALNYATIENNFSKRRNQLIGKLRKCKIVDVYNKSFAELIDKVGDIETDEYYYSYNVKPTIEPQLPDLEDVTINEYNIALAKKINYYMRLLGYYLILKGIPKYDVHNAVTLKTRIDLIDMVEILSKQRIKICALLCGATFIKNITTDEDTFSYEYYTVDRTTTMKDLSGILMGINFGGDFLNFYSFFSDDERDYFKNLEEARIANSFVTSISYDGNIHYTTYDNIPETYDYDGITIYSILYGVTLIKGVSIEGNTLTYTSFEVDENTTISDLSDVLTSISYTNGILDVTTYGGYGERTYFVNEREAQEVNDFITDISYNNGELTYVQLGDNNE